MAMLEGTTKPPVDHPRRSARANDPPGALEPNLAGGITGQVPTFGIGEQRTQMQRGDALLDIEMDHHGGVLSMRAAGGVGVPPGLDQAQERLDRAG
jgi:hypothetical protein